MINRGARLRPLQIALRGARLSLCLFARRPRLAVACVAEWCLAVRGLHTAAPPLFSAAVFRARTAGPPAAPHCAALERDETDSGEGEQVDDKSRHTTRAALRANHARDSSPPQAARKSTGVQHTESEWPDPHGTRCFHVSTKGAREHEASDATDPEIQKQNK